MPLPALPQVLGVKKVALLFVTGAHMPHDALWRLWLESAAGLLPQQALPSLLDAACGPVLEKWLLLLCACYPKRVTGVVAAVQPPWQYLFSLYVHSPPWGTDGYQGGHLDALWHCLAFWTGGGGGGGPPAGRGAWGNGPPRVQEACAALHMHVPPPHPDRLRPAGDAQSLCCHTNDRRLA